eukprot:1327801-Pyramimonas_sp.AAC.1
MCDASKPLLEIYPAHGAHSTLVDAQTRWTSELALHSLMHPDHLTCGGAGRSEQGQQTKGSAAIVSPCSGDDITDDDDESQTE